MGALLDFFLPSACVSCGRPPAPLCGGCESKPRVLEEDLAGYTLRYSLELDPANLAALASYKDRGMLALEKYLASHLLEVANSFNGAIWLACPPRNAGNFRRRGYDPVQRLVSRSGLASTHRQLRIRATRNLADQRKLSSTERRENLRGGFHCPAGVGTVLIVDDVVTTGSTSLELATTLRGAGYEVLGICAIARRFHSVFPPQAKKA